MGIILDPIKQNIKDGVFAIAQSLNNVSGGKITPNMITYSGLIAHIGIAMLIAYEYYLLSGLMLIIFGLFDTLDGQLARLQKSDSKRGMLLDSVTDRLKEIVLYSSIAYALIASNKAYFATWTVLACGFSILVSYVNAWGEVVTKDKATKSHTQNHTFRVGFMSFEVRMAILIIGLITGYVQQTVIIIACLSLLTAITRFNLITKKL